MSPYDQLKEKLADDPAIWLVTGAAGFIGSNLVESLLRLEQKVIGLDNLSTGRAENLARVQTVVGATCWKNFRWIRGDVRDAAVCRKATRGADFVLHQAALASVPGSLEQPALFHDSNVNGFVNMVLAARENGVKRFVYASSSSVYGDESAMPQKEQRIGKCLSPYALTKRVNELYAEVFAECYGFESIGLRYFNVFGPRQDPNGAYAAVISKWIAAMLQREPVCINGDGSTTRDFCYIANVVQANLLAATTENRQALNQAFNIAVGAETSLLELFGLLRDRLAVTCRHLRGLKPSYAGFRAGDIPHSCADISRARRWLGYQPTHNLSQGLDEALPWYVNDCQERQTLPRKGHAK